MDLECDVYKQTERIVTDSLFARWSMSKLHDDESALHTNKPILHNNKYIERPLVKHGIT